MSVDSKILYHFSEDPQIERFEPRPGRQIDGRSPGELLVWAIDEDHSPVYYFPRECPRILLWPIEGSTQDDIDRWMASTSGSNPRMVANIESAWLERFKRCRLYRYTFATKGFDDIGDHGVSVNSQPVEPLDVTPVGSLVSAIEDADVELRVMESLQQLADAWFSTLHFSGVRLRNARDWTPPACQDTE